MAAELLLSFTDKDVLMPGQAGQGITNRSKVARKLTHPLSGIVSVLSACMSIALRHIIDGCGHLHCKRFGKAHLGPRNGNGGKARHIGCWPHFIRTSVVPW